MKKTIYAVVKIEAETDILDDEEFREELANTARATVSDTASIQVLKVTMWEVYTLG